MVDDLDPPMIEFAVPTVLPLYKSAKLENRWDCTGWRKTLTEFMSSTSLASVLAPLSENPDLADSVSRASYSHVTGFDKIILLRNSHGALIKLDVWWPESADSRATPTIHSHQWNFSSLVLNGRLSLQHFAIAMEGQRSRIYRLSYPPGTFERNERDTHLTRTWSADLPKGSSYDLDFRVLHATGSAESVPTVTLVVQSRPLRDYSEAALYRELPEIGSEETESWREAESLENLDVKMESFGSDELLEKVSTLSRLSQ